MLRKTWLAAFMAALFFSHAGGQAQDAERKLELVITGASRGYMRPLRATTERIRAIEGLGELGQASVTSGLIRCELRTKLDDEALAAALAMQIVDSRKGRLVLAPAGDTQGFRAEARLAILAIADAAREKFGEMRSGRNSDVRVFYNGSTEQKLKFLGLDTKFLDGKGYKLKDYHIEYSGSQFRLYAGAKWEGVPFGDYNDYEDYSNGEPAEPDPASRFVGARMIVHDYNPGFWWTDLHGVSLNVQQVERDVPDMRDDGKLAVQVGGERLASLLQAAARYRFEGDNAKKAIEALVKGNFGFNRKIGEALKIEEDYWDQYFGLMTFALSWFKDDAGHAHARIRAYHSRHPLHLDGDIDCDAAQAAGFDFNKVEVHWTVAPEAELGIFERRRAELAAGFAKIRDALFALEAPGLAEVRKGALAGEALCAALKLKVEALKGEQFAASDYSLRPQIFGDAEVRAGSPVVGCESWTLLNLAGKSTIRSFK